MEIPQTYAKNPVLIQISRGEALKIYTDKAVLKLANFVLNKKTLKVVKYYAFYNSENLIDIMVVRFEDENNKKHVLTYWFDGVRLKMRDYPILIYGRNLLEKYPNKPVLIHEGEKCADIGNWNLKSFVSIAWNGGGKKWNLIQGLEVLKGREIYLFPDDDQMRSAANKSIFPPWQQPGLITMFGLKEKLKNDFNINSNVVGIFPELRLIKKSGADIEEMLKAFSPEIVTNEILKCKG